MVSTRSKTAQTHLEDFATNDSTSKPKHQPTPSGKAAPKANTSRKRKSIDNATEQSPKRTKTKSESAANEDDDVILINRAPVLHLWAASVTHLVHPELDWESCLSAGAAASAICAVAKGRSIGKVAEKDSEDKGGRRKEQEGEEVEVMHFKLKMKGGLAVVGSDSKGKSGDEDALRKKFGDDQFTRVKDVFEEVLESWKGEEEELNKEAFKMYEEFRPDVSKGQKGWGRKGELRLERVRDVVGKQ